MQEEHKFITKNGGIITSDANQKMKCTTKVIYQKIEWNDLMAQSVQENQPSSTPLIPGFGEDLWL